MLKTPITPSHVALALVLACTLVGRPASASTWTNISYLWNGTLQVSRTLGFTPLLVGRELNGTSLEGRALDGRRVVSVDLSPVTLESGESTQWVSLHQSNFYVASAKGWKSGKGLVGAVFTARLEDGATLELRVDAVDTHPDKRLKDVMTYEVSYATQDAWLPLCGIDVDGLPVMAVPLNGRWDHGEGTPTGGSHIDDRNAFTFACADAVLGKCALGGYAPWRKVLRCETKAGKATGKCTVHSLAEEHQACTRLLRADYCGDGRSFTQDGVLLNMFDGYGVRADTEQWAFEGEWTAQGARCLATTRSAQQVPACYAQLADPQCGMTPAFASGTVLVSELAP